MKKKLAIMALILCMAIIFTGCKGSSQTGDNDGKVSEDTKEVASSEEVEEDEAKVEEAVINTEEATTEDISDEDESNEAVETSAEVIAEGVAIKGESDLIMISNYANYWNDLYTSNEAVLNAYEGMPIMELITPGLCFITGCQYDMLDLMGEDGHFEGELMLAGYQGFVDKKGSRFTFGYEEVLEENGFSPSMQKGDKMIENGSCDLDKGYYFSEDSTDRAGVIIKRSTSEFQKQEDGSVCAIVIEGSTLDYNNKERLRTSYIFIQNGKDQYDFVVAESEIGAAYALINLDQGMTKEEAKAAFESAGATITTSGGIVNGTFTLDK